MGAKMKSCKLVKNTKKHENTKKLLISQKLKKRVFDRKTAKNAYYAMRCPSKEPCTHIKKHAFFDFRKLPKKNHAYAWFRHFGGLFLN